MVSVWDLSIAFAHLFTELSTHALLHESGFCFLYICIEAVNEWAAEQDQRFGFAILFRLSCSVLGFLNNSQRFCRVRTGYLSFKFTYLKSTASFMTSWQSERCGIQDQITYVSSITGTVTQVMQTVYWFYQQSPCSTFFPWHSGNGQWLYTLNYFNIVQCLGCQARLHNKEIDQNSCLCSQPLSICSWSDVRSWWFNRPWSWTVVGFPMSQQKTEIFAPLGKLTNHSCGPISFINYQHTLIL
jgi:hypothetical protein